MKMCVSAEKMSVSAFGPSILVIYVPMCHEYRIAVRIYKCLLAQAWE